MKRSNSTDLDNLNKLYTSNNPEDIVRFYSNFSDAASLVEWMKNVHQQK